MDCRLCLRWAQRFECKNGSTKSFPWGFLCFYAQFVTSNFKVNSITGSLQEVCLDRVCTLCPFSNRDQNLTTVSIVAWSAVKGIFLNHDHCCFFTAKREDDFCSCSVLWIINSLLLAYTRSMGSNFRSLMSYLANFSKESQVEWAQSLAY